jgi:hypothetical protein
MFLSGKISSAGVGIIDDLVAMFGDCDKFCNNSSIGVAVAGEAMVLTGTEHILLNLACSDGERGTVSSISCSVVTDEDTEVVEEP